MKLTKYEKKVFELMLKPKVSAETWEAFLNNYSVKQFDNNQNAGYYLTIRVDGLDLQRQTIDKPNVIGIFSSIIVGFLLFVERDEITIECHDYGVENNSSNLRMIDFKVEVK